MIPGTKSEFFGIERVSVLDPVRRSIWSYGGDFGDDNLTAYDIDSNEQRMVSTDNLPGNASGAGLAYDVANDHLEVFGGFEDGAQRVYNYDITTGRWSEYPYPTGTGSSERTFGRFLYDEVNNVFFLIDSIDGVCVWKNTLGNRATLFRDGFESGSTNAWSTTTP